MIKLDGTEALTIEEQRELFKIRLIYDAIFNKVLEKYGLVANKIIFSQLLVDMIDMSVGEDAKPFKEALRYHFGEEADAYGKIMLMMFKSVFEKLEDAPLMLVRVAALQKLHELVALAPKGTVKVVDGQLLVKKEKKLR